MANPYRANAPKINKTPTHKSRILVYLRARQPNWIIKGELENQAIEWGCFGDTIARRLRELVNEKRIEVKIIDGVTHYRLTQASEGFDPNAFLEKLRQEERQGSLL